MPTIVVPVLVALGAGKPFCAKKALLQQKFELVIELFFYYNQERSIITVDSSQMRILELVLQAIEQRP